MQRCSGNRGCLWCFEPAAVFRITLYPQVANTFDWNSRGRSAKHTGHTGSEFACSPNWCSSGFHGFLVLSWAYLDLRAVSNFSLNAFRQEICPNLKIPPKAPNSARTHFSQKNIFVFSKKIVTAIYAWITCVSARITCQCNSARIHFPQKIQHFNVSDCWNWIPPAVRFSVRHPPSGI